MGASGRPLGTSGGRWGIPKVSILGHFMVGMVVLGSPGGEHPWALHGWDGGFGGSLHVLWTIHSASQPGRPMTSRGWRISK